MSKTPVIGILETGRPPEELAPEHGNYPSMVQDWLDLPEAEYKSFAALDGQLPDSPRAADLWVITGSPLHWSSFSKAWRMIFSDSRISSIRQR